MVLHIFAHNFLNIQPIFNPQKSFGKLRLRAFQPYHQMLSVGGVKGYFNLRHLWHASTYIVDSKLVELWINRVWINRTFLTWNDRNLAKISKKLPIKWNFELTVPDLYLHLYNFTESLLKHSKIAQDRACLKLKCVTHLIINDNSLEIIFV